MLSNVALTILLAASPVLELRGAIPIAIFSFGIPPLEAYLLGVVGSSLPVIPLLIFWNYLYEHTIHKIYFLNRFFSWFFEKTQKKHKNHFDTWKALGLLVFVAIPMPFTGAWSGTVAAFVFGIPIRKAIPAIVFGNMISGAIVLLLSGTALSFL